MAKGGETRALGGQYVFGRFVLDTNSMELDEDGQKITIERKLMQALLLLLEHAGEVVTHGEFMDAIWADRFVTEQSLTTLISKLRKVIGSACVTTVHGYGYRFDETAQWISTRPKQPRIELTTGSTLPARPNWRANRQLGSGGSSDVWLFAHQKTGEHRVFKFAVGPGGLRTLKREITISRILQQHSLLANRFSKAIDWELSEAPFFIEFADYGQNLLQWAEASDSLKHLVLSQRLDLIVRLAEAIDSAHSLGVLHKDLKPSNIFVLQDDGAELQLIIGDFGASGLLDGAGPENIDITRLGFTQTLSQDPDSISGSLMYIAPEVLAGQVATARSDIYALGVILYQVVSGNLRQPLPSDWQQHIDAPELQDDIARATASDPDERMASAAELAMQIQTIGQRRIERERAAAAAANAQQATQVLERESARRPWIIAAVCTLLMGTATSIYFQLDAAHQRNNAQQQLQRASALNQFLQEGLIRTGDPNFGGTPTISLVDAVKKSAQNIDRLYVQSPDLASSLHASLGSMFAALTQFPESVDHWRRHIEMLESEPGAGPSDISRARLFLAEALAGVGDWDAAETQINLSRTTAGDASGDDGELVYLSQVTTAFVDFERGERQATADVLGKLIPAEGAANSIAPLLRARARHLYANCLILLSRSKEALAVVDELLKFIEQHLGREHVRYLYAEILRSAILADLREFAMAESEFTRLKDVAAHRLGETHKDTLSIQQELGVLYAKTGRLDESVAVLKDVYKKQKEALGETHRLTLATRGYYATVLMMSGRLNEAKPLLEAAYHATIESLGTHHPETLMAGYNFAELLINLNDQPAATAIINDLRAGGALTFLPDHEWHGRFEYLEGSLAEKQGDRARALQHLRSALRLMSNFLPETSPEISEIKDKISALST